MVGRISRQLEVLAGKYPAGKAGKTATLPRFPKKRPTAIPCTVLNRRPDLLAAERRLAAADQGLVEAKRAILPTLDLTTMGGTLAPRIGDIFNREYSIWSLAGNVTQPLLQNGRIQAGLQNRNERRFLAASEYEQAILTAFSEVENALAAERFFAQRAVALTEAAKLSKEAFKQANEEYY